MKEINTSYNMAYRGQLGDVDLNTLIHDYDNGYYEVSNPTYVKLENNYPPLEFTFEDLQNQVPVSNNMWLRTPVSTKSYHVIRGQYTDDFSIRNNHPPIAYRGAGIYNLPPMGRYPALPSDTYKSFLWSFNTFGIAEVKLELFIKDYYTDLFRNYGTRKEGINDLDSNDLSHIWVPYKKHIKMLKHFTADGEKCITGIVEILSDNDLVIQTFHRSPDETTWVRSYNYATNEWTTWASEIPSFLHTNAPIEMMDLNVEIEEVNSPALDFSFRKNPWEELNTKKLHNDSYETEIEIDPNIEVEIKDTASNNSLYDMRGKLKDLPQISRELERRISSLGSSSNGYPGRVEFPIRNDFINNGEKYKLKMGLSNKYDEYNMYHIYKDTMTLDQVIFMAKKIAEDNRRYRTNLSSLIGHTAQKNNAMKTAMDGKFKKSQYRWNGNLNVVNNRFCTRKNYILTETNNNYNCIEVEHREKTYKTIQINKTRNNERILTIFTRDIFHTLKNPDGLQPERLIRGCGRPFVKVAGENKGHLIFHAGLSLRCINPYTTKDSRPYPRFINDNISHEVTIPRYYTLKEEPVRNPYPTKIALRMRALSSSDPLDKIYLIPGDYFDKKLIPTTNPAGFDINRKNEMIGRTTGYYIEYKRKDDNFDTLIFYGCNYRTGGELFMEVYLQE